MPQGWSLGRYLRLLYLGCAVAAGATRAADLPGLRILEAVRDGVQARTRPAPEGSWRAPVLRPLHGALAAAIQHEAQSGTTAFVLRLDALAQRLAGATPLQPAALLLSDEEGGYARRGYWLQRAGQPEEWHGEPYVNMVIDAASVRSGEFEEIFAHESGHVLLRRLLPHLPTGYSRARHSSLAITDYSTAFDEGFAIHFQALARRLTVNPLLRARDGGFPFRPYLDYWQDAADGVLRIVGVRGNLFVQAQLPWPDAAPDTAPDAAPLFDPTRLKNAQQMMADEGVIATLFYHLLDAQVAEPALSARYEALLRTLRALDATELAPATPVFLRLVQEHVRRAAGERARWLELIAQLTYCATAEPATARGAEALARLGRSGDAEAFAAALGPARRALQACSARLEADPARLEAALGRELWVASVRPEQPLRPVNLNTAEAGSLRAWLGFDTALSEHTLRSRDTDGPFADLSDFARRVALTPAWLQTLAAGAAAVQAAGPYVRE
ncbi:MAG: hypothetical protein JO341_13415 [Gammaproteobacteria bacterium]|nr:hypothetical protein [Gammaproteobacteria bacterium]